VLINISTSYAYPKDSGDLIEIGASAEALFPFDGGAWHVYLGQDTPESKRIRADILTGLFEAQTYLMVDPDRLRFGVWVGYELHEKFGPLRVDLEAWLDGQLTISRMPFQADGRVTLFGGLELGAGPVSVGLSVEASVAVEVPNPFSVSAEMTFELKTPLGNPKATVMFVGEAPGRDEDLQGEPFVGRAGQLLDKILEAIGWTRNDVYIANILKCRPPGNRNPEPPEVAACEPILQRQIQLIDPLILCTLGAVASKTLLGTTQGITKLRGTLHEYRGIPVVTTYHPAALLRNPNWKRPTWEDVQMLRREHDRLLKESGRAPA